MKIRQVGAEFFYADGRTDGTKVIVAFRKFANAQKYHNFFFFIVDKTSWEGALEWRNNVARTEASEAAVWNQWREQ